MGVNIFCCARTYGDFALPGQTKLCTVVVVSFVVSLRKDGTQPILNTAEGPREGVKREEVC